MVRFLWVCVQSLWGANTFLYCTIYCFLYVCSLYTAPTTNIGGCRLGMTGRRGTPASTWTAPCSTTCSSYSSNFKPVKRCILYRLKFEFEFELLVQGPMNHVRLQLNRCPLMWTPPESYHEMDKIESEQPNCHFTINEEDPGDAAHLRYYFKS
jgi:hypothetical protein